MRDDSTQRFSGLVDDYARYRPAYPAAALDLIRGSLTPCPAPVFADLGSGTGILTKMLLDRGCTVYAVEPNGAMRAAAEATLGYRAGFHSAAATAESTGLPDACADAVTAAQAFHWFDVARVRSECVRIMKPAAPVFILFNERRVNETPFLAEYEALLLRYAPDYTRVDHRNVDAARLAAFFGGAHYEERAFSNVQHFDEAGLMGRARSCSYVPRPGQPGFEPLMEGLRSAFAAHARGGRVSFLYTTRVYFGPIR